MSNEYVCAKAKKAQFRSLNKYLQWLITKERNGVDGPMASLEETVAKSITRVQDDLNTVRVSSESMAAFLHAFAKMFLVTIPEAAGDERVALLARAQRRYQYPSDEQAMNRELWDVLQGKSAKLMGGRIELFYDAQEKMLYGKLDSKDMPELEQILTRVHQKEIERAALRNRSRSQDQEQEWD